MKMKWDAKRHSPSSSGTSIITRVFPASWLSKFKQKGGNPETNSGKKKERGKLDNPTSLPAGWSEARFYSVDDDDDDAYWRLSFCGERTEGRRSITGINPLWCDFDDEFQVPVSSFKSFGLRERELPRREKYQSFDEMVLDIRKMKEKQHKENIMVENGAFGRKKANGEAEPTTLRKKDVNDRRSRKLSHRVAREKVAELKSGPDDGEKSSELVERDVFPIEQEKFQGSADSNPRSQHNISFPNFSLSLVEEDHAFSALDGKGSNEISKEWQDLENKDFKETEVKSECQRKSACKSRKSHSRKIKQKQGKAYSPKTECRIRVLEDMKKARKKLKKKETKEQVDEGRTIFDSFAVVKNSFNPQQDFRDSMVEMIIQKGIRRPEELEELLACYLTLNGDGYHDLIIKVFQQVWFELNRGVYQS